MDTLNKKPVHFTVIYGDEEFEYYLRSPPHPVKLKLEYNNDEDIKINLDGIVSNIDSTELKKVLDKIFTGYELLRLNVNDNINIELCAKTYLDTQLISYLYPAHKLFLPTSIGYENILEILSQSDYPFGIRFNGVPKDQNNNIKHTSVDKNVLEKFIYLFRNSCNSFDIFDISDAAIINYLYGKSKYFDYIDPWYDFSYLSEFVRLMIEKTLHFNDTNKICAKTFIDVCAILSFPQFQEHDYTIVHNNDRYLIDSKDIIYEDSSITTRDHRSYTLCKIPSHPGEFTLVLQEYIGANGRHNLKPVATMIGKKILQ